MRDTLTQQILAEHILDGRLPPGEEVQLRVDQACCRTPPMGGPVCSASSSAGRRSPATPTAAEGSALVPVLHKLEAPGINHIRIPFAIVHVDHNVLAIDFKNADDHLFLQSGAPAPASSGWAPTAIRPPRELSG